MNINLTTVIVSGAVALACSVIGACGTLIVTAVSNRNEERRHIREITLKERQHFRELGLKIALTNFEHSMALAQSAADRFHEVFHVPPLKGFIIQGVKLVEIICQSDISAEEMARRIAESEDFTETIVRAAQEKADKARERQQ